MADDPRIAYLQARLQARHGDRLTADDWRVAEASTDLSHYLDAIRRTALKRWVADIDDEMEPEAIERMLRAAWRDHVDQITAAAPEEWRPAVEWLRWLPDLSAIEHLLRGGKVPPWMRADPVMRGLAYDEPQRRREALAELPVAPLQPADDDSASRVVEAWLEEWRRRLPRTSADQRAELDELVEIILHHLEAMRASAEPDGRALRNTLAERIVRRFRRGAGTVTALFSHLVLDGLEFERVRAGVMTRKLLPERSEGRSWA